MIWIFLFLGIIILTFIIVVIIITLRYISYGIKFRKDLCRISFSGFPIGAKIDFLLYKKKIFTIQKSGDDEYTKSVSLESEKMIFDLEELLDYILSLENAKHIRFIAEKKD
jgi:hypothetical protein